MPPRTRSFMLCVGVEKGVCQLINEYDLSALLLRPMFDGAQVGKWYRFDLKKGSRIWEQVEDRMPTKRVKRIDSRGIQVEVIQVCLPICFVPNFKSFGYQWKNPAINNAKFDVFYSPRLETSGKVSHKAEKWAIQNVNPGKQYYAYLTLTIKQLEREDIMPPQWTIESDEDFLSCNEDLLGAHNGIKPLHPEVKEWGVLLKVEYQNDQIRLATILCLRDGQLAFGRIFKLNDFWRADVGDIVGFCSIEVDCYSKPLRMAMNMLAWNRNFNSLTDQFPQESIPNLPSIRLIDNLADRQMFELQFPVNEEMLNFPIGSYKVDKLGTLMDLDGKLNSSLPPKNSKGLLLARVSARFCMVQQAPLWLLDELIGIERSDQPEKTIGANQQIVMETGESGRSSRNEDVNSIRSSSVSSASPETVISYQPPTLKIGGFGSLIGERWQQKQRQQFGQHQTQQQQQSLSKNPGTGSNSIPLGNGNAVTITNAMEKLKVLNSSSNITVENKESAELQKQRIASTSSERQHQLTGIVLYLSAKGDELNLLFYDEQTRRLSHPCTTKKCKVPFPLGSQDLLPGNWYQIVYNEHRTPNTIGIVSIQEADKNRLPTKQVNPHNPEVWTKLLEGKYEDVKLIDEHRAKPKNEPISNSNHNTAISQPQQQIPKPQRNPPVPVTNVFARTKSGGTTQATVKAATISNIVQPKFKTDKGNSSPPLLCTNAKFFHVKNQMAGIVVADGQFPDSNRFSYQIWPFCTGRTVPRELNLCTKQHLPLGHWIRFELCDFERKVIAEENSHGLAPWMQTRTRAGKFLCIDCEMCVPADFGTNPTAELCTRIHKPADQTTPFIRKLIPRAEFLPQLTSRFRGTNCRVLIEYESEPDENGEARGYWRVVEMR